MTSPVPSPSEPLTVPMPQERVFVFPARAELGDVALVDGRPAEVITINSGNREIGFQFIGAPDCPTCGRPDRVHINEGTPLWNDRVRGLTTCGPELDRVKPLAHGRKRES